MNMNIECLWSFYIKQLKSHMQVNIKFWSHLHPWYGNFPKITFSFFNPYPKRDLFDTKEFTSGRFVSICWKIKLKSTLLHFPKVAIIWFGSLTLPFTAILILRPPEIGTVLPEYILGTQCMHSISLNFNLAGKDPRTHTQMPNFFEVKKCSLQMKCKKKYPKNQQFL